MVLVTKIAVHMPLLVIHAFLGLPHVIRSVAINTMGNLLFRRPFDGLPFAFRIQIEIVDRRIHDLARYLGAALLFLFGSYLRTSSQGPLRNRCVTER